MSEPGDSKHFYLIVKTPKGLVCEFVCEWEMDRKSCMRVGRKKNISLLMRNQVLSVVTSKGVFFVAGKDRKGILHESVQKTLVCR